MKAFKLSSFKEIKGEIRVENNEQEVTQPEEKQEERAIKEEDTTINPDELADLLDGLLEESTLNLDKWGIEFQPEGAIALNLQVYLVDRDAETLDITAKQWMQDIPNADYEDIIKQLGVSLYNEVVRGKKEDE